MPDLVTAFTVKPAERPCRGVEPVRDELEFRDRILAVLGLLRLRAGDEKRDLLAVDVDLRIALARVRHALPASIDRTPGASSARSIQFRPCSGIESIC